MNSHSFSFFHGSRHWPPTGEYLFIPSGVNFEGKPSLLAMVRYRVYAENATDVDLNSKGAKCYDYNRKIWLYRL